LFWVHPVHDGNIADQNLGILKNWRLDAHPPSHNESIPTKEETLINTNANAGPHHPPGAVLGRMAGSRRQSNRDGEQHHLHPHANPDEPLQRLKWDEANLYLAEQERTATMKINEPKTPYAKHYDPDEDPSDMDEPSLAVEEEDDAANAERPGRAACTHDHRHNHSTSERDIPNLSLGEPEDDMDEVSHGHDHGHGHGSTHDHVGDGIAVSPSPKREKAVHVDESVSVHGGDGDMVIDDDDAVGPSAEEREKHRRFEELRKKHYEMKEVAHLLGHAEGLEEEDDEAEGEDQPPLPE